MIPFGASLVTLMPLLVVLASVSESKLPHPLSDDFINLINSKQSLWKAGRNFPQTTSFRHIRRLMGVLKNDNLAKLPYIKHDEDLIASLPDSFDPRDKWPSCSSLNEIRDQGSCGSGWAVGPVGAMTDRVCIFSNGTQNIHFSAQDLVSCCQDCGFGCGGGFLNAAWEYWRDVGIVSGGPFNSSQGCRPYEIPPCEHYIIGNRKNCSGIVNTPKCKTTCEPTYNVKYQKDKHYGKQVYLAAGEDLMKAELFMNGPAGAMFRVYTDFLTYKSGVYKHIQGDFLGWHSIKIMGWGVENGNKYWLIANSWNTDWGDKGFFKILRGENHCGIEGVIAASEPMLQ